MAEIILPGDIIGSVDDLECGSGCYASNGIIRASLSGRLVFNDVDSSSKRIVNVFTPNGSRAAEEGVVNIGDKIICQVQRVTMNQAVVGIICVGDREISEPAKGIIRREDITVRSAEIDSIVLHECFRPGDIVRAEVVSLGDSRQYFLTTDGTDLGVIGAKSQSGHIMVPVSVKVMCYLQTPLILYLLTFFNVSGNV